MEHPRVKAEVWAELTARRSAQQNIQTQADLDNFLRRIPAANRQRILDRLRPHLRFEPKPLGGAN